MRDLSVQASQHGGLYSDAKKNIQSEITQLKLRAHPDRPPLDGKKLLDGAYTGSFQVGASAGEKIAVAVGTPWAPAAWVPPGSTSPARRRQAAVTARTRSTARHRRGAGRSPSRTSRHDVCDRSDDGWDDKLNGTVSVGGKTCDLATVELHRRLHAAVLGLGRLNATTSCVRHVGRPLPSPLAPPVELHRAGVAAASLHRGRRGGSASTFAPARAPTGDRPDRPGHPDGLDAAGQPRCAAEPVRADHGQPERRRGEPRPPATRGSSTSTWRRR